MIKQGLIAAILMFASVSALADHHGRGQEQLNGFPGIYNLGFGTATFTHDGFLVVVVNNSKVAAMMSRYTVSDGVMTLQAVSPPAFFPEAVQQCLKDNTGIYDMVDNDAGFSLVAKEEPCPQRAGLVTRAPFVDYVRPE